MNSATAGVVTAEPSFDASSSAKISLPSRSGNAAETTARPRALRVHVSGGIRITHSDRKSGPCHAASTDSSAHDASTSQRACDRTVTYRAVHDEAPPWSAVPISN